MRRDRLAPLLALARVGDAGVEAAWMMPTAQAAVEVLPAFERRLGDLEAIARLADETVRWADDAGSKKSAAVFEA